MSAKHTPGPWYFQEYDCVPPCYKAAIGARHNRSIAVTTGSAVSEFAEENKANARLIAAAPELLAALEKLMGIEDRDDVRDTWGHEFDTARAAIAKAKGE